MINPCHHSIPAFGCESCIHADIDRQRQRAFDAFAKTVTVYKTCSGCGGYLKPSHYWYDTMLGELKAVFECGQDADVGDACDDSCYEVVIPQ